MGLRGKVDRKKRVIYTRRIMVVGGAQTIMAGEVIMMA